jgi:hypothetical protein
MRRGVLSHPTGAGSFLPRIAGEQKEQRPPGPNTGRVHPRTLSLLALPAVLILAPAAPAATLSADRACYPAHEAGRITGTGFAPAVPWTATLDGSPAGRGTTAADGTVDLDLEAPEPSGSHDEELLRLALSDGTSSASVSFKISRTAVTLSPSSGRPGSWRARFRAVGFGEGAQVWLHRVDPRGRLRGKVPLGTATGACGGLRSARVQVLPRHARGGIWKLVVNTSPLRSAPGPRAIVKVAVPR